MKKIFIGTWLLVATISVYAQGLEDVIVEKIPVTAAAVASDPTLPANAVAYRVFVDLKPGYEMQAVYGEPPNVMFIQTSTSFYNHPDGPVSGRSMSNGLFNGDPAYRFDSYITIDGVTSSRVGILLSEDTDGTVDGYTSGTSLSLQTIGPDFEPAFGSVPFSGKFEIANGAYNVNGGETGTTPTNRVLIGQFTTDGIFSFELGVQIRNLSLLTPVEKYVPKNAVGLVYTFPKLAYSSAAGEDPVVSVTSPANGETFLVGNAVSIAANATDADGTISLVEFLVDGTTVGDDDASPYQFSWLATAGDHAITARATDNGGNQTVSAPVNITVSQPVPPVVSITSPTNGAVFTIGSTVNIEANATDGDGTIAKVEFYRNGEKLGEDLASPYLFAWTAVSGPAELTARATDNQGNVTNSSIVSITVNSASVPPTVSITSPANGASFVTGVSVAIAANASDADGTVSKVEFFVNGVKIGEDLTTPYQTNWTAVAGNNQLTAVATDNSGNTTTSAAVGVSVTSGGGGSPVVSITAPIEGAKINTGTQVTLVAEASDPGGSITLVEFFVNSIKIGEDATAPYQLAWAAVAGLNNISAKATDNQSNTTMSAFVAITVMDNFPPEVVITAPAEGATFAAGTSVNITANATDVDGTVTKVEFFNKGQKLGEDLTAPYQVSWVAVAGSGEIYASATDDKGKKATSDPINITVTGGSGTPPSVNISTPAAGTVFTAGETVPIGASATDADGTVSLVEFFVNAGKIGEDNTSPYSVNWTSVAGAASLTAKATDNSGNQTTSAPVSITVNGGGGVNLDTVIFDFSKAIITGNQYQLPIMVNSNRDVTAFSFSTIINTASITFNQVVSHVAYLTSNSTFDQALKKLNVSSTSTQPAEKNKKLISISFTLLKGSVAATDIAQFQAIVNGSAAQVKVIFPTGNPVPPVVSITSPANGANFSTGASVAIAATATDTDGTISLVEFFVNGTKIGEDATSPYQVNWPAAGTSAQITARATDNAGNQSTSAAISVTIGSQGGQSPSVSITSPVEGAEFTAGQVVAIAASAQGPSAILLVEFFINNFKVGQDDTAPFVYNWTSVAGTNRLTALVTDAAGAKTLANTITISVNAPPQVSLLAPVDGSKYLVGDAVVFEASASDADGTVTKVEFFANGTKVGEDLASPYAYTWTATEGSFEITASATDNKGAVTTTPAHAITVVHPYAMDRISQPCYEDLICMPLRATEPIANIIGFDIVVKFDAARVLPTGVVSLYGDLINTGYADYAANINQANSTMLISVFLKPSAPEGTSFTGTGRLLCMEFTKTQGFGASDSATFTITTLNESYFTGVKSRTSKPGKAIAYKDFNLYGSLKYWSDNSPIAYDAQNPGRFAVTDIRPTDANTCAPLAAAPVHPDVDGNFRFDVRNGQALEIIRDIANTTEVQSAVNGTDAQLAMKVMLGDPSFIPSVYQMMAMDVNLDGSISSGDISQINQRSILMIKEFKQAWNYNNQGVKIVDEPSKDWLFINQDDEALLPAFKISASYPAADGSGYSKLSVPQAPDCFGLSVSGLDNCPQIDPETYIGVMLGDVNGNFGTLPADGKLKRTGAEEDKVIFDLGNARLYEDKMEFPVYYTADYTVTSLDFQMKYNEQKVAFDTIVKLVSYIDPVYFYNTDDSTLRFTSYSLSAYQPTTQLIYIRFDVLDGDLSAVDFYVPKAWLNGERVGDSLTVYSPTGINDRRLDTDIRIYPNPARSYLTIESSLPATAEIVDLNGRVAISDLRLLANEKKSIGIGTLPAGVYLVRVYSEGLVTVRKLIVNR